MKDDDIVIVGAARTPMGAFLGDFVSLAAHDLGGVAIEAAVSRAGVAPQAVEQVLMGNCLMAGQGQAPARQAAHKAGLPRSAGAITLSKMCGSGMSAVMLACDLLQVGTHEVMVAGGMESMSRAPHLLLKSRTGIRLGHDRIMDHMMLDGLEDAYEPGRAMGSLAEECAAKYAFSRQAQDEFAMESIKRAQVATQSGAFAAEIAPVQVSTRAETRTVSVDEGPLKARPDKVPQLKPVFKKDGTITAASSSSINDGAAALVLMCASTAKAQGLKPLARVVGHATHSHEPEWFTTAPIGAVQKLLAKVNWSVNDVELWEVNEAFAAVPMALMQELKVPHRLVNIHGGACALGHPIGASGARVLVTLLYALQQQQKTKGIATLCIGGGEGVAMAIERL